MNKLSNYVRTTLAFITGDSAMAIATANERKSFATFKAEIARIDYETTNAEERVADCREALRAAIHPSERISSGDSYLQNIQRAEASLQSAINELEELKHSKEYWTRLMQAEEAQTEE